MSDPIIALGCVVCGKPLEGKARIACSEECRRDRVREVSLGKWGKPLKPCQDCGGEKEPGRGSRLCAPCRERRGTPRPRLTAAERRLRTPKPVEVTERTCPRCNQVKPVAEFGRRATGKAAAYCAPCQTDYAAEYSLRTKYGITQDESDLMFLAQGGRCAICLQRPRARKLAVDHCHKSGVIRGLLCTRCNHKLLGAAHEDVAILQRAIDYLSSSPPAVVALGEPRIAPPKKKSTKRRGYQR